MPTTISCHEIPTGRGSGIVIRGNRIVRTTKRVYRIRTNEKTRDGYFIIEQAALAVDEGELLPKLAEVHPTKDMLSVIGYDPSQEDVDGRSWLVTVNYDDTTDTTQISDGSGGFLSPIDRPVRYHMEQATFTRVVRWDIDGFPIANTIGDEFDVPLEEEDCTTILVAVKNYLQEDLESIVSIARAYKNTLNADNFHGCPPGTVRFMPLTMSELQTENSVKYYTVTFRFELKDSEDVQQLASQLGSDAFDREPGPWDRVVLNTGRYAYKTADDGFSKYKLNTSEPQKLKRDGRVIEDADIIDFYYRVFSTKRSMPFSILGV